jgi:hypothetical protein
LERVVASGLRLIIRSVPAGIRDVDIPQGIHRDSKGVIERRAGSRAVRGPLGPGSSQGCYLAAGWGGCCPGAQMIVKGTSMGKSPRKANPAKATPIR